MCGPPGEMDFKCSACNSALAQLDVGAVVTSIGQTLIQFEQAIKVTKIQALLDKLAGVELEGCACPMFLGALTAFTSWFLFGIGTAITQMSTF